MSNTDRNIICYTCDGAGMKATPKNRLGVMICETCNGHGMVLVRQNKATGFEEILGGYQKAFTTGEIERRL